MCVPVYSTLGHRPLTWCCMYPGTVVVCYTNLLLAMLLPFLLGRERGEEEVNEVSYMGLLCVARDKALSSPSSLDTG